MTSRAVPFHCPYCSDENLFPHGEQHGAWECRSCMRAFGLKFLGQLNPAVINDNTIPGRREA